MVLLDTRESSGNVVTTSGS